MGSEHGKYSKADEAMSKSAAAPGAKRRIDFAQAAGLLACIVVIVVLWDTWAVYPLRLLVVFFHELSHGIAALVTGGSIVAIQMNAQEGGVCVTRGGNHFVTLSAGYLGSLIWGGVILVIATRTKGSQIALELLGALLLVVTIVWVRPMMSFGFGFGMATGLALILVANIFRPFVTDLLLIVIGLTSCLYAVLDIKSDILDRPEALSDAAMLSQATGIPTWIWGALWFGLSLALAIRFILTASRKTSEPVAPVVRP